MFLERQHLTIKLIATSGLILFTELAVIRFLSSYILYIAYFTNIILIASFFGIGLGSLLGNKKKNLLPLFSIILLFILLAVAFLKLDVIASSEEFIVFQNNHRDLALPLNLIGVLIFVVVSALFIPLGQLLGQLLNQLPPLWAYTWDIIGSIIGIVSFTLLSFLGIPPIIWFSIIGIVSLALLPKRNRLKNLLIFLAIVATLVPLSMNTRWSPYYKITLEKITYPNSDQIGWGIFANDAGHQTLEWPERKEYVYHLPYAVLPTENIKNILIIGAGGGTDTAVALNKTKAKITAVDIDPVILELGKKLHPARPYDSDRVTRVVNDGRAFLEQTDQKFDLIIFALTDSLTLASSYANTRLENYLYTKESLESVKKRLTDSGAVVLYNHYRYPWLVQKLAGMVKTVFDQEPEIYSVKIESGLAAIIGGPGARMIKPELRGNIALTEKYLSSTDNWPFLYLIKPKLPIIYIFTLISVLIIALLTIYIYYNNRLSDLKNFHWHFFWLGAGFLLLETKNVINFSLLFGATWLVNALVFFAILAAVLIANLITIKYRVKKVRGLYLILGILLLANLLIPLKNLLTFGIFGRYVLASALTFSPVILANLIFSNSFYKTPQANLSFGANLLGAVVGGLTEYFSMVIGYHWLLVVIMLFYLFSWLVNNKKIKLRST